MKSNIFLALFLIQFVLFSQQKTRVEFLSDIEKREIKVTINGNYFTSFLYPLTLEKPVLFPILSANGTLITRGFPINPRSNERVDHPHHIGHWFSFGSVNKIDFWNNSYAIPDSIKFKYGKIILKEITMLEAGEIGKLQYTANWESYDGTILLKELTTFVFSASLNVRIIERTTSITAVEKEVVFEDNKEGLFAMRVAREFETPSFDSVLLTNNNLEISNIKYIDTTNVNGHYISSNGLEGESAWGTKANWVQLRAIKNNEKISIIMFDHPKNPGYPAHWHTRGYGLFSINNFGQKVFNSQESEIIHKLKNGASYVFKHKILISSNSEISKEQINKYFQEFSKSK